VKIFGDDGFRDRVGQGLLNEKFLNNFFLSLNLFLEQKKIDNLIIGFDTRSSKNKIIKIITKNLFILENIYLLNKPISTPGIQLISKKKKLFGIMITASHFANNFNGFKFFNCGNKLTKKDEKLIEKNLLSKKIINYKKKDTKIKKLNSNIYYKFINKNFKFKNKKKVIIDCANGSVSAYTNKIKFLHYVSLINTKTRGNLINVKSGSNLLDINYNLNPFKNYDYCLAFDGDADRVVIAKKGYGIIEPEKIALIFASYLDKKNKFKKIIATEIANPWLKLELQKIKKKILFSKVGDRNVIQKKKKYKALFGFENSGHFCFNYTMDGLFTAGLFLKILNSDSTIIDNVLIKQITYYKKIYALSEKYQTKVNDYIRLQNKKYIKVIIRKSIWNNYFKIYIFYNKNSIKQYLKIYDFLKNKVLKIKVKN
jgi:phosphomannomutase